MELWHEHIPNFLLAHEALHTSQRSVTLGSDTFKIHDDVNPYKDLRRVHFKNGWHMLTQNMKKESSNTAAVRYARSHGDELWTTWVFDKRGYRGRIDTSIHHGQKVTRVHDLKTHEIMYY